METKTDNEFNSFVQGKAANEASHLVEATTVNEFNSCFCLFDLILYVPSTIFQ